MKTNTKSPRLRTHESAVAKRNNAEQELRRSVMACLLWEDQFYESGVSIADRIEKLVPRVSGAVASRIASEARNNMKLRHVPLWIVRIMAKNDNQKGYVAETLADIIQRPDEITEFLSLYWLKGRCPISKQVKKGLAQAFLKFDEYQLAKWNKKADIKLRDAMNLVHPRPQNKKQEKLFKRLLDDKLATPDTWEVELSASSNKKESWTRLLDENRLGGLALLRNLRNMEQAGVSDKKIANAILNMNASKVLPFRFVSAAKHAGRYEPELETAMFKNLEDETKLAGKTVLLVDTSGSMSWGGVSGKSELSRLDAAGALAVLLREVCERVEVVSFASEIHPLRARRGFALLEQIKRAPSGGTNLGKAVRYINDLGADRLIVVTDEQSHDRVPDPSCDKAYMINVASYKNGVGYGKWTHLDGWSESLVRYIQAAED